MVGPGRPTIDEHQLQVRTAPGDHQPGHAAAGAEVDDGAGDPDQRGDERIAVRRPRRAPAAARASRGAATSASAASSGPSSGTSSRQAGLTMIRRFGSSPSDRLVTPSIAVSASWITLRSADGIGSSERATPDSLTMLGHAAGEALEGHPALLAVAGHVDAQAGVVIAEATLGGDPGEVLDRQQRAATGADQQAERTVDRPVAASIRTSISLPSTLAERRALESERRHQAVREA